MKTKPFLTIRRQSTYAHTLWPRGVCLLLLLAFTGCPDTPPPITSVALEPVASGLTSPLGMAVPDDDTNRLFVLDQIGLIRVIDAGGHLLPEPFLDLRDRMVEVGIDFDGGLIFDERGLLGLDFHPDYATNGRFFVFYTAPRGEDQPPRWKRPDMPAVESSTPRNA